MSRADARSKLTGEARFGTDLDAPGMLWGVLVLASESHARIRSLDLAAARAVPGAIAIGAQEVSTLFPRPGDPARPLFPKDEVRYRSEPIAAVAAPTLAAARLAASRVAVDLEPLPPLLDVEAEFPQWPGPDGTPSAHVNAHVHAKHGDLDAAFRDATLVLDETYHTNGVHQVALEPHACLARPENGGFDVESSTQSPYGVRDDLASILGVPEKSVKVRSAWVGGGFGGKAAALLEPYAVALAAAANRPVKLSLTYREEFLLGRTTLPAVIRIASAVRGGRITARRVRLLLDTGASLPGRDFALGYSIGFLVGPYRVPAVELEGYAVRTNKPPFGPHRAPFMPQCVFAVESHMDALARRLKLDPIEFRLANALREGDVTAMGQPVGPFGLVACLERARSVRDRWRKDLAMGHGLGIGCGHWSTSTGAGGEARVTLTPSELIIHQVERDIGNGSVVRGLVAVVETTLGIPGNAVRVETGSTADAPFDSGVFGSRTLGALGQAVQKAAQSLLVTVAERVGSRPEELRWQLHDGELQVVAAGKSHPVASLLTAAERRQGGLTADGRHYGTSGTLDKGRVVEGEFYAYTDFTAAVDLAEVSVDRETGTVRVERLAAFHDIGRTFDRDMVQAQVEGGVAMGLGAALTEEAIWSDDGRLLNPGLLDYRIPTLGEIPPIEVTLVESFAGAGPMGAKGIGEPPIIPVPAAVANAVADATGAEVRELPLSAERVARVLMVR